MSSDVKRYSYDMCRCGKNESQVPHSCPYAQAIADDDDDNHCDCCSDCQAACAHAI